MKKSDFGSNGAVLTENSHYLLRIISEQDKESYIETCRRTSNNPGMYKMDGFDQFVFAHASGDSEINCSIIEKATGNYCGYCNLRSLDDERPEIGISLLPEYQRKGIGCQMLPILMRLAAEKSGVQEIVARVYNDNTGSRRLMEKLGAAEYGREESELTAFMQKLREQGKAPHIEDTVKKYGIDKQDGRYIVVYMFHAAPCSDGPI